MGRRGKPSRTKWRVRCICGWKGNRVNYNFNKMCPRCKRFGYIEKIDNNSNSA